MFRGVSLFRSTRWWRGGFLQDAPLDGLLQLRSVQSTQWQFLRRVETAFQLAVRCHPDAAAVGAEVVTDRRDQAYGAQCAGQPVPPGHAVAVDLL